MVLSCYSSLCLSLSLSSPQPRLPPPPSHSLVFSLRLVVNFSCNLASEVHPRLLTLAFGKLAIDACSTSSLVLRQFCTAVWIAILPDAPWVTWWTAQGPEAFGDLQKGHRWSQWGARNGFFLLLDSLWRRQIKQPCCYSALGYVYI